MLPARSRHIDVHPRAAAPNVRLSYKRHGHSWLEALNTLIETLQSPARCMSSALCHTDYRVTVRLWHVRSRYRTSASMRVGAPDCPLILT
jgi:hypothetical protein